MHEDTADLLECITGKAPFSPRKVLVIDSAAEEDLDKLWMDPASNYHLALARACSRKYDTPPSTNCLDASCMRFFFGTAHPSGRLRPVSLLAWGRKARLDSGMGTTQTNSSAVIHASSAPSPACACASLISPNAVNSPWSQISKCAVCHNKFYAIFG